ncbi:MAG: glycoside hydrolase [Thermoanaerobaculia bacterium]|nr:glycoside hydrolase [Thermoanaerobaculia bacterium]
MIEGSALSAPAELTGGAVSDLGELRALGCDVSWMSPPAGSVLAYGESAWIASPSVSGSVSGGWGFIPIRALTGRASTARAARCGGDSLYVATDRGLESTSLRSGSSRLFGSTFSHYSGGATAVLPLDADTVLVGVTPQDSSASPVLRCDVGSGRCDASASGFTGVTTGVLLLMKAADGSILLVLRNSVWRSTDGGRTFAASGSGLPANPVFRSAADVDGQPAVVAGGAVWRSANSGASWAIARTNTGYMDVPPLAVEAVGGGNGVLLAAINGSTDGTPVVYRSTNGGSAWTGPHAGIGGRTVNRLLSTPEGTWAATNAGVFFSTDGGVTWQARNAGLTNLTVNALADAGGSVLAATPGEASGLYRSTNGGATWTPADPAFFANRDVSVLASMGPKVFAGGTQFLYSSTDGGATWSGVYYRPGNVFPASIAAANGYFYAGLSVGTSLYRTSDIFAGWEVVSPSVPAGVAVRKLAVSGSNVVIANGATLYKSTGGAPYAPGGRLFPTGKFEVSRLLFAGSTLWAAAGGAAGAQYGLFRSSDVGATWTRSQTGIPTDEPVYDISVSGSRLYAATRGGPYVSDDGGTTWTLVSEGARGLPVRSILASSGTLHLGTAGESVLSFLIASATGRLVPVVLDVDTGATRYTTDMSVTNRGTSDVQVTMTYTPSLGSGSGSVSVTIRAGTQLDIPDVLAYLRQNGVPIATGGQQAGTLLLSFTNVSDPDAVGAIARTAAATAAPQPVGRAGLAYAAIDPDAPSADTLRVYALRESGTDRSNVAVYNTSGQPVTVEVKAVSGDGSGAASIVAAADTLPAWGWKQYNRVLATAGMTNGWVEVKRTSATGSFSAYGVVNDNGTNDGSFVTPNAVEGRPLFMNVPVLVQTGAFLSELVLTNGSSKPGTFVLTYVEALATPGPGIRSISVTLPPKTQQIIPNAIDWLRSHNIAVGPAGSADAGALNVFVSSGAGVGEIFAGSRTAAPSPAGGQFGLFSPAALAGDEATATAFLYGLRADANNRSNVAAVNTGSDASAGPITLLFEVFDGAGGGVRGSQSLTLDPGEWGQLSGPLAQAGVSSGWVKVSRTAGSAPWIAYGVVNDGGQPGQRTGDGAYVPMAR